MKYTAADKSDKVYKYNPVERASIAKRKWIYDSEADKYRCPLELPSIGKAFCIALFDGPLTEEQRILSVINGTLFEFAQYGRVKYDEYCWYLEKTLSESGIRHRPLASYDNIIRRIDEEGETPWDDTELYDIDLSDEVFVPTAKIEYNLEINGVIHNEVCDDFAPEWWRYLCYYNSRTYPCICHCLWIAFLSFYKIVEFFLVIIDSIKNNYAHIWMILIDYDYRLSYVMILFQWVLILFICPYPIVMFFVGQFAFSTVEAPMRGLFINVFTAWCIFTYTQSDFKYLYIPPYILALFYSYATYRLNYKGLHCYSWIFDGNVYEVAYLKKITKL